MARQQRAGSDRYAGLVTRARWKPADAARVIAEWTQSGESMTAFARRHGLALHRLHYWRDRLGPKGAASGTPIAEPGVRFVPAVAWPPSAPLLSLEPRTATALVCVVEGSVRVEVSDPQGTDPRWVASLIDELRRGRA